MLWSGDVPSWQHGSYETQNTAPGKTPEIVDHINDLILADWQSSNKMNCWEISREYIEFIIHKKLIMKKESTRHQNVDQKQYWANIKIDFCCIFNNPVIIFWNKFSLLSWRLNNSPCNDTLVLCNRKKIQNPKVFRKGHNQVCAFLFFFFNKKGILMTNYLEISEMLYWLKVSGKEKLCRKVFSFCRIHLLTGLIRQ